MEIAALFLLSDKSSNVLLLPSDEGSFGNYISRVSTFITSGDESAQRATSDESWCEGDVISEASRIKDGSNTITTVA